MKTIEELLKNLARPEVLEFGLVTNRLPSVNIGGKFEPVDDEAPSTERLMQMLVTMGGSRYVDSLNDKPVQWTTRLDGVGVIAVAAILRKDVIQARFTVAKREAAPADRPSGPGPGADRPSAPSVERAPAASSQQRVAAAPPPAPSPSPSRAAESSASTKAAAPIQPQVIKTIGPSSTRTAAAEAKPAPAATSTSASTKAAPRAEPPAAKQPAVEEEEWDDDDDEPTLQTLSPPVKKPVRRAVESNPDTAEIQPKDVQDKAAAEKAAQEKAASERAAAEKAAEKAERAAAEKAAAEKAERAAAEKAAAEKAERAAAEKAAAEKAVAEKAERAAAEKAAAEKAAAEKAAAAAAEKAAAEKAAAEKAAAAAAEKAAAERAAAEKAEKAAAEKAAAEKAAAEKAAQRTDQKAAQERATQELVRIREQRAAQERAARERSVAKAPAPSPSSLGPRRINTPTSVDAVDVEITTQDAGSRSAPGPIAIDLDEGAENTVSDGGDGERAATGAEQRARIEPNAPIDPFLAIAATARASDLHLVAGRPALLRIAGDLVPRTEDVPVEQIERFVRDLVPPRLRDRLDGEGACDFGIEHPAYGRFRVNVSRQRTGYKLSLRVIPKDLPTPASVGLPDAALAPLRRDRGLILVVGESSQGKSTTLAAFIEHVSRETARHIVTIEELLEFVHPRRKGLVSQREVGLHTRSKARAIQSTRDEDSDVVVIADLTDAESIRLALAVAESGRLVLAAMSAPSAAKAIERIDGRFSGPERAKVRAHLAAALRLVVAQRLLPGADRARLHLAVELLPWSVALHAIVKGGDLDQLPGLFQRGKAGIVRMEDSIAELLRSHKITPEVAKRYGGAAGPDPDPTGEERPAERGRPAVTAASAQGARK